MHACLHARTPRWVEKIKLSVDGQAGFKKILLNECQTSFERFLKPPVHLKEPTPCEHEDEQLV